MPRPFTGWSDAILDLGITEQDHEAWMEAERQAICPDQSVYNRYAAGQTTPEDDAALDASFRRIMSSDARRLAWLASRAAEVLEKPDLDIDTENLVAERVDAAIHAFYRIPVKRGTHMMMIWTERFVRAAEQVEGSTDSAARRVLDLILESTPPSKHMERIDEMTKWAHEAVRAWASGPGPKTEGAGRPKWEYPPEFLRFCNFEHVPSPTSLKTQWLRWRRQAATSAKPPVEDR